MTGWDDCALDGDIAAELLAVWPRRYLLSQLRTNDRVLLEDVAREIAARERDESPRTVSADARESAQIALVHNHLPRLADHGVVEYDRRNGDIVPSTAFEDLEPILERLECISSDEPMTRSQSSYSR